MGMTALGVVGDLVEKAIVKAGELNEEYQLSSKAADALKEAVDKAKAASKYFWAQRPAVPPSPSYNLIHLSSQILAALQLCQISTDRRG